MCYLPDFSLHNEAGATPTMRRVLLPLIAAIMLALSPSAAFAYGENDQVMGVSDSNPGAGETFTVTIQADDCASVLLEVNATSGVTIDGQATTSATTSAVNGEASFEVAISEEGEYTLTGYCADTDEVLGTSMVVVGGAAAGGGGAAPAPNVGGVLPATGSDSTTTVLAAGGLVLLLAGGVLLMARRRKGDAG